MRGGSIRASVAALGFLLALAVVLPMSVLLLASGLSFQDVSPSGISASAFGHWTMPHFSTLLDSTTHPLWASLAKTLAFSLSAAGLASSLAMLSAYLITRRRLRLGGGGAKFLALSAYGLPSVFLLLAFDKVRLALDLPPGLALWTLHFIYLLPMATLLSFAYAETHPRKMDRAAALDGGRWPVRFWLSYRGNLWRGHLGVFAIGVFISWGDVAYSRQLMDADSKLLTDLYLLRYFDQNSTAPDYAGAALFSLVLVSIGIVFSYLIARTTRTAD